MDNRYRSAGSYEPANPNNFEEVLGPSVTIPDHSLSIQEILERHVKGQPIPQLFPVYYGEEDYLPNVAGLDLTEKQDLLLQIADARQAQYDLDESERKASIKKAFEASVEAEIEKRKKNEGGG